MSSCAPSHFLSHRAPGGSHPGRAANFAYVFERFPSFTQTFCAREVEGWIERGIIFPIFSIHSVANEEIRHFPPHLYRQAITLPQNLECRAMRWCTPFAWRARWIRRLLRAEWGARCSGLRAAEAAWLGPRLRKAGIQHVHVHFAGIAARTAFWVHRAFGITYSLTAHANDFLDTKAQCLRELFQEARFIVSVSEFGAERLRQDYPEISSKVHRVYNGLRTNDYPRAQPGETVQRPVILSIGRLIEKKGFSDLIAACAHLRNQEFECQIIGEGPLREALNQQIAEARLQEKVRLLGPLSENQIRAKLQSAHLFALACRKEKTGGMDNLPTVIMEAMAAGLPIVSTRLGGIPEMVEHAHNGLLSSPESPAEIAGALRTLLQEPRRRAAYGEAGWRLARERFDLSVTSEALHQVFASQDVCALG